MEELEHRKDHDETEQKEQQKEKAETRTAGLKDKIERDAQQGMRVRGERRG